MCELIHYSARDVEVERRDDCIGRRFDTKITLYKQHLRNFDTASACSGGNSVTSVVERNVCLPILMGRDVFRNGKTAMLNAELLMGVAQWGWSSDKPVL